MALKDFGRYHLERRLASGGMGEVYLARQTGPDGFERVCVLKAMHPQLAASNDFVQMFLDEARLTAQLNHAHIAQVYDFGKFEGTYFLAIEWVDGVSLADLIREGATRGTPAPIPFATRIASQAAQALHYVHRSKDPDGRLRGLIHRDVSPANLMLSGDGVVKMIDFGIAKARASAKRTQVGAVRGKLGYLSPEQAKALPLDGRADLYALGLVLYELLTGQRAISGQSDVEQIMAAVSRQWAPVEALRPECPKALAEAVRRATAALPEDRYATAGDFSNALEEIIAAEQWVVTPSLLGAFADDARGARAPHPMATPQTVMMAPVGGPQPATARMPAPTVAHPKVPLVEPAAAATAPAVTAAALQLSRLEPVAQTLLERAREQPQLAAVTLVAPTPAIKPVPSVVVEPEVPNLRSRAPWVFVAALAIATIAAAGAYLVWPGSDGSPAPALARAPTESPAPSPAPAPAPVPTPAPTERSAPGVPRVTLTLSSVPPKAEIYEGETLIGTTPLTFTREAGAIASFRFVAKGYQPEARKVGFLANQEVTVALRKDKPPVVRKNERGLLDSPY